MADFEYFRAEESDQFSFFRIPKALFTEKEFASLSTDAKLLWAFDYDKMFCVLMENEICRKVCEKNKYNSWMKLIGNYCFQVV